MYNMEKKLAICNMESAYTVDNVPFKAIILIDNISTSYQA